MHLGIGFDKMGFLCKGLKEWINIDSQTHVNWQVVNCYGVIKVMQSGGFRREPMKNYQLNCFKNIVKMCIGAVKHYSLRMGHVGNFVGLDPKIS